MKVTKRINCFFDRVVHEVRIINLKKMIISGSIFLALGILSWIIGGKTDKLTIFFLFPRSAIPLGFMFVFWGIYFVVFGFIFSGVLLGCEKYKRQRAIKIGIYMCLSYLFTFCIYPAFFGGLSFLGAFVVILIAEFFCLLALHNAIKLYSFWSICLSICFLWLMYNGYVALSFSFIN